MKLIQSILSVTTLLLLTSCGEKAQFDASKPLELISSKLYSDRPQNYKSYVALIRLKKPALFATAKKVDGKLVIDEEQKAAVIKEQKEFMASLEKMSKDITLIFSYRFVANAVAVHIPMDLYKKVAQLGTITSIEKEKIFNRLDTKEDKKGKYDLSYTSVDFIGASKVHKEMNIKGKGIKVGVIDTGIDYTHKMMGGVGTKEAFTEVEADKESKAFPNKKVVGGYDFAGTNFSPGSINPDYRIPRPDKNPIDEGGHGTHVAGTVAGIGDGINTYSGVAPEAELYALKVFGANGGTSDTVVIAALEYSADPNGDMDPSDRLDVVNLSLGGNYGKPYVMYDLAVQNISKAGVVVVAAAGNSGHNPYIVGSPSTATEAISVAASRDGMKHNWQFASVSIADDMLVEVVEGDISKPVAQSKDVKGKLVHIGDAATELTQEQKDAVAGNIALIDRGKVTFVEKAQRAFAAKAIGIVVANHKPNEAAFPMGGDKKVDIPAIMITLAQGDKVKEMMKEKDVVVNFGSEKMIEKKELIDTLTDFTSRGPRSLDGLIKPEIAAPGYKVISAAMGSGDKGVAFNGTSMAAPHMAGVMALVKEKFNTLSVKELKAITLNNAKTMQDKDKKQYDVAMQGAGRVQVYATLKSDTLVMPGTISLGQTALVSSKTMLRRLTIKNLSKEEKTYKLVSKASDSVSFVTDETVTVAAESEKIVNVRIVLKALKSEQAINEIEARLMVQSGETTVANIPVFAVSKKISTIAKSEFEILADSPDEMTGAATVLKLKNTSKHAGSVIALNLLGIDERKEGQGRDNKILSRTCDLKAAGYKIVNNQLHVGVKLYNPVSLWQGCEVSVQIDTDGDKKPEQEIAGISAGNLRGLSAVVKKGYFTVLLDAKKARFLRKEYETNPLVRSLSFVPAIEDIQRMEAYHNSTIALLKVDLDKIKLKKDGQFAIQIATMGEGGVESDDFLGEDKWITVNSEGIDQGYIGLPETIKLDANSEKEIMFEKGEGSHKLLLLYPHNKAQNIDSRVKDLQSEIL